MKTNDYIKQLKKHLSVLEHNKKEEIVKEIESYIEESDASYSLLVERFGTPQELANSYLEDMPINESKGKKIWSKTKKAVFTIIIFLIVVSIAVAIFVYNIIKDPFDYAKFDANTIDTKVENQWKKIDNIDSLDIEQAKVVLYGSDKNVFEVSCEGNKNIQNENTFVIKQSRCFLKVPKQKLNIKSIQSEIVFVEPKDEIQFNSRQSRIRVASKKTQYKYELNGEESDFKKIKSNEEGILIKGKVYQSEVVPYEY